MLADGLSRAWGQPVVVETRPGASGVLATHELSQSAPDGHTWLVAPNSLLTETPHLMQLQRDLSRELAPLAELASACLVLVAAPTLAPDGLPALLAHVRAHPGRLSVASYSAGTISHVLAVLLNRHAGLDLQHVGYKGSPQAHVDVLGGHVALMFDVLPSALPLLRAGRLKAYAVSSATRHPLLPEVPSFAELGLPQLEAAAWLGLWARPDSPPATQTETRRLALAWLGQPGVQAGLRDMGLEPGVPSSTAQLAQRLAAEHAHIGALLRSIGFKPQ